MLVGFSSSALNKENALIAIYSVIILIAQERQIHKSYNLSILEVFSKTYS